MPLKFVEPLMPTLVEKPPEGEGRIHEVKFDGYRSQIIIDHDVRFFTRNGHDWTTKHRDLPGAAKRLGVENAILVGRVKHLRGEQDLRHASLQDFREED